MTFLYVERWSFFQLCVGEVYFLNLCCVFLMLHCLLMNGPSSINIVRIINIFYLWLCFLSCLWIPPLPPRLCIYFQDFTYLSFSITLKLIKLYNLRPLVIDWIGVWFGNYHHQELLVDISVSSARDNINQLNCFKQKRDLTWELGIYKIIEQLAPGPREGV